MKLPTIAIGTLILGLLIGAGVMYAAAPSLMPSNAGTTMTETMTSVGSGGLSGTVTIGDLVSLTGDLSAYGQRSKVAVDIAISDINSWLSSTSSPVQFQVRHEDTATDPATALQKLQTLAAQGIQVYVGPMTSGEARNILSYANTNHLVLISQSSTAENLGIPNDYLFRLVPTDFAQSKAVARVVFASGAQYIVVVARHDTWGDGLSQALEARFTKIGGTVIDTVSYTPISTGTYDFSPQLTQMKSDYDKAVSSYGASKVAIVAVAFDELAVLLQQAKSYQSLLTSTWFGTDGTAESGTIISTSGDIATQVKSLSTIYAPTRGDKWAAFTTKFTAKYNGPPDAYTYAAYDATWVAALTILSVGKNDGQAVQGAITGIAGNYYGVSGWPDLNQNGDRTISDYDIWQVEQMSGKAEWVNVGTWSAASDSVSYF